MIAFLQGTLHSKADNHIVLDVHGVGYEVFLGKGALIQIGEVGDVVKLDIHTHYTEANLQLYGFINSEEKSIFKKMISVSGIGPKLGQSILSAYPLAQLIDAVASGNLVALTSISGIGKKTAERIVTELRDPFKNISLASSHSIERIPVRGGDDRQNQTLQALVALGYSDAVAWRALQRIEANETDTVQNLIKKSLGVMSS